MWQVHALPHFLISNQTNLSPVSEILRQTLAAFFTHFTLAFLLPNNLLHATY